jgi:hypothetical protein
MYHIACYIPQSHLELVKKSMFEAGAGHVGNYDSCSFEFVGLGQFRPLQGSDPFLGKPGEVELVTEVKLEMMCKKEFIKDVIKALRESHPYETPAYYAIEIVNL